jgi:iron complex transport system permease protein
MGALAVPALGVSVVALFAISLTIGPAPLTLADVLAALTGQAEETAHLIVIELRLPRAILATMIGATLGLAGATLQGFLRNPLAEPGLIGVSTSAALGAVLMLYTGAAAFAAVALPAGGIIGGLLGMVLVQALAGRGGSALTLILAGIAVTSFTSALTALALNFAPSPFAALEIVFWLMGSLADRGFDHVWIAAPFMAVGWALLAGLGRALDALTLGGDTARTLGFDTAALRMRLVLGIALSVGAATAVAGAIGFIGLVVPHLLRPLARHRPGALLGLSALGGAGLLLAADIAVRILGSGRELKIGVLTTLLGAPFFLWLILKQRRRLT